MPAIVFISPQRQRIWTVWERLQPRMKPAFFAAEAAPTGYFLVAFRGHGPLLVCSVPKPRIVVDD